LSGLSSRVAAAEADLRRYRETMKPGAYDLVVSNPPYYLSGSGKQPADPDKANARAEQLCTFDDICKAAGYLTRGGGAFMLVHKPQRLVEILRTVSESGFEPKRARFVQHDLASPPSLVLLESRRGGKPSLKIEAPLILYDRDGRETDETREIYRR
jgi:tRNA1Val (adenine37-N6)-methyltransferase